MSVSVAESVIMEALWRRSPLTAEEIIAEIAPSKGWGVATVKTLLNRLLKKKAICAVRDGRRFLYSPSLAREDYLNRESRSLVDRLFEGRLSSLVLHFSEHEQLSAADIAELKRLVAELDDGH